jgi:hypothetical protein
MRRVMPAARQPDSTPLFAAAVQSFTPLSHSIKARTPRSRHLPEFQLPPASDDTAQAAEREQPEKESDKVLAVSAVARRRTRAKRLNSRSTANKQQTTKRWGTKCPISGSI